MLSFYVWWSGKSCMQTCQVWILFQLRHDEISLVRFSCHGTVSCRFTWIILFFFTWIIFFYLNRIYFLFTWIVYFCFHAPARFMNNFVPACCVISWRLRMNDYVTLSRVRVPFFNTFSKSWQMHQKIISPHVLYDVELFSQNHSYTHTHVTLFTIPPLKC